MPKSKRNKIVHLTQVKKKGKDHKEDLMKQLEEYISKYSNVYLFDFDQTKSDRIMNLRLKLKEHGRIFAGRNSVVTLTLRSIGSRTKTNYANLTKQITGHRGLFFTNLSCNRLVEMLEQEQPEFREKLLGYAQLKATDDDTGDSDAAVDEEADDSGDDEDEDEDAVSGRGGKMITFKTIEKPKAKKKKNKKRLDS